MINYNYYYKYKALKYYLKNIKIKGGTVRIDKMHNEQFKQKIADIIKDVKKNYKTFDVVDISATISVF